MEKSILSHLIIYIKLAYIQIWGQSVIKANYLCQPSVHLECAAPKRWAKYTTLLYFSFSFLFCCTSNQLQPQNSWKENNLFGIRFWEQFYEEKVLWSGCKIHFPRWMLKHPSLISSVLHLWVLLCKCWTNDDNIKQCNSNSLLCFFRD